VALFGQRSAVAWVQRWLYGRARRAARGAPRPLRVVGHRGAPRLFPENTIASFAAAVELGADAIEVDVCLTRDDAVVLWHDNEPGDPVSLARGIGVEEFAFTCDWPHLLSEERKPVYEMTLAEMRAACSYSPKGLTLTDQKGVIGFELAEDLFRWANGEARLAEICFDVKLRPEDAARAPLLVECIARLRRREDLACTLLLPQREVYGALAPLSLPENVRIAPDFELPNILAGMREIDARWVSTGYTLRRTWGDFTRELAALLDARDAGKVDRVLLWTFNDERRLRYLVESGVDGILTDDIALLRRIVDERGG
jgi:glycerophosphoryl diester phosphodiesterase